MTSDTNTTIGKQFFTDLENNEYLKELYNQLLIDYSYSLFNPSKMATSSVNIDDCLRFADLLSKSVGSEYTEKHKTLSQEIVSLLLALYPDDKKIKTVATSVLTNVGNYKGINIIDADLSNFPYLDKLFIEFDKKTLSIPYQKDMYFFRPQKYIYDHFDNKAFSYSGPTSMGKSLLMRMFIKDKIATDTKGNFAILIPTKALISEISSDIIQDLKGILQEKDYRVVTSAGSILLQQKHNFVFVMTPERFLYLLIENPDMDISYLFIDEAHKISAKKERSAVYYKITDMLSKRTIKPQVIFASPNIPNPDVYLPLSPYFDDIDAKVSTYQTSYSPVSQLKYVIDCFSGEVKMLNNYTGQLIDLPFKHNTSTNLTDIIVSIKNLDPSKQTLVYFSSKEKAIKAALAYETTLPPTTNKQLLDLATEIENEIHSDYYLARVLRKGIAYHVGYLPSAYRDKIEKLYKSKDITHLFCTSTLLEGVNLPADNLIITSIYNGSKMTAVEFKNLIGRVGRISFNLYGNAFVVRYDENQKQKQTEIEKLLQDKVEPQELSINKALTGPQRESIVKDLMNGTTQFNKCPIKQGPENQAYARKIGLILLKDILDDHHSIVRKGFEKYLGNDAILQIKQKFGVKTIQQDDDIFTSVDQAINLHDYIAQGHNYPSPDDYNGLVKFLEDLYTIFKWEYYEKSDELGNKNKLKFYAVIIKQWVNGFGLKSIIESSINHHIDEPYPFYEKRNMPTIYNNTISHKNIVITEVLGIIENIVLFKIANYFNRFSAEYKLQHDGKSPEHDWYEYVEYGSTNKLNIMLQRSGFSREISDFIKQQRRNYVIEINGEYFIKKSLLNSQKEQARLEAKDVILNYPELFVD